MRPACIHLSLAAALSACLLSACAPRTAGLEARKEADARFRRTTSLVSFDQARQAFEAGDLEKARQEVEAAIARSDTEARYWSLLGRIELEARRLERAVSAFDRAMECDPSLAEAYYYRGVVHQRWGAADRAIEDYLKAAELDPERIAYLLAAAEMLVTGRRLDEARDLLLPKLAYFEHNAAVHELLGDIASLQDNHRAAARSYERSMMIDPDAPLVSEKALGAMFRAGEWQRCLEAARRLRARAASGADGRLAVVPADVLRHEGRSLAMLGRHQEARAVFADHARQYPEDAEAWRDLATASIALGEFDRAQSAAERFVTLARDEPSGYTLRGMVAERANDLDTAIRWHVRAVEVGPDSPEAAAALGLALRAAGREQEAAQWLRRAFDLDPGFTTVARALESIVD
ncbi:MAG: tetratricopeptide repeat protein [Phycisphaera sp.]|nr:tetratricopeptide repeat protein [Phycisphaera sp.]